jgi:hypothetical protein
MRGRPRFGRGGELKWFDKIPQGIWEQRGGHNCHVTRNTWLMLLW